MKYQKSSKTERGDKFSYKDNIEIEEIYEFRDRDERPIFTEDAPEEEREKIREVVKVRQAMPRDDEQPVESLEFRKPEVFGSLFDRVTFLKERIEETSETIKTRGKIHNDMVNEINEDIAEREGMESRAMDLDEKRNIRLDISLLRKEKRNENVRFWKDLTELRVEFREVLEKYQTEKNILEVFKGIESEDE
jgi:hypothetical protein